MNVARKELDAGQQATHATHVAVAVAADFITHPFGNQGAVAEGLERLEGRDPQEAQLLRGQAVGREAHHRLPDADQDRQGQQQGQAAGDRAGAVLFVELEGFLGLALAILGVLALNLAQLGLEDLHFFLRLELLDGQGQHRDAHQDGEDDDRPAKIACQREQPLQDCDQWFDN